MTADNNQCVGEAEPRSGRGAGGQAPSQKPIIIGVTGGMASGKSSIAQMISGRGIIHIDADKLVHDLMKNDREMIAEVAAAFPGVMRAVGADGKPSPLKGEGSQAATALARHWRLASIDRQRLAAHVAKHPESLATLEQIIHPRVRALEKAIIAAARRNRLCAVVLDIPLLFETDADALCDVVIVAHAPLHHRRRRAFARVGMTEEKWQRLLSRQLPDHIRNHAADVVIATGIGKAATRRKIHKLMRAWGLL